MNQQLFANFAKLALIAAAGFAVDASATTATDTFEVKMTIVAACDVTAGTSSDIDFSNVSSLQTNLTANNAISVTCSKNTPYYIGLAPSNGDTTGAGLMSGLTAGNTDTVPYQLRSTSGIGGTIWGNTATSTDIGNGVGGIGNGAAQSMDVYATAPDANFTPDSYSDTVTVTVNY
ncbi:MAG TPA: spore coat protein U domain-containing protein [Burkholderiaceae bacterium]|jgi:spore coat protein U-like protein|nr:spore coat protein U domain-containing protein [Burkholderiaceae bacterium]